MMKPAPVFFGMWIGMKPLDRARVAALLHVVPGVVVMDDRREGEVVDRRRRRGRPFQRAAVPRVARGVAQLPRACMKLTTSWIRKRADAERDQDRAEGGDLTNQICSDGSSKWLRRRVTPIRPSTYSGMKAT